MGEVKINPWVYAVGGTLVAVLMAVSGRYGFQRDELYFLDCARHLSASYVDQPGFAPLLARVSLTLFGVSAPGMRIWPALAAGGIVVLGGLTAREFGGGRRAQLLAAVGAATMPAVWGADHVANTTGYEFLAWAALAFAVARIGRTGDNRWWLLGGLAAGLGMADNHLMAFFALAIVLGVLLSRGWRRLRSGWFAAAVAIAVAGTVPDIWWQARHGWAAVAMTHALNGENGSPGNIPGWVVGQLLMAAIVLVWVWVAGLVRLWRSDEPLWRALAWAYGLLFVLFAVTTGGKVYYLAGAYVYLLAAGAVAIDGWLEARTGRIRGLSIALAVNSAIMAVLILPVLPATGIGPGHAMDSTLAETVGWPQLVGTVRTVWMSLPPDQRADAVIFTADYSEAGAINELGRGDGLPTAVSGQNTVWWWGPGNANATTVVVVVPGAAPDYAAGLSRYFSQVRVAATLTNPYGVHNIESGGHVYVCTGLREPWGQLWPQLRHYD